MNNFENIFAPDNDKTKKSNSNYIKRKVKQFVVGASLLGATAQFADASNFEYEKQKISEDDQIERITKENDLNKEYLNEAESIRKGVIERVSSADYLNKLMIEFGDELLAKKEQEKRIANLKNVKLELKNEVRDVMDEYDKLNGGNLFEENNPIDGFYTNKDNRHMIFYCKYRPSTLFHELLHASTKGNSGIPDSTKKILQNSYDKKGFLGIFNDKKDDYHSIPTERLVRLQHLMDEMDSLGICKYGENFTEEKYKTMMDLYEHKRLSNDSMQLIERTKSSFQNFKEFFEKIASNKTTESDQAVV